MTNIRRPRVLLIDSGAGGLSILQEILDQWSGIEAVFVADKAAYPYGQMEDSSLIKRVVLLCELCLSRYQPDLVVIACNTASTIVLETLRRTFPVPFVGVVPAVKPAAALSRKGKFAVLATKATVNREYLRKLLEQFAENNTTFHIGSAALVDICENYVATGELDIEDLQQELSGFINVLSQIDILVLACTHFPLIKAHMCALLKERNLDITLLDSGEAIARRVRTLLEEHGFSEGGGESSVEFASTAARLEGYSVFLRSKTAQNFKTSEASLALSHH